MGKAHEMAVDRKGAKAFVPATYRLFFGLCILGLDWRCFNVFPLCVLVQKVVQTLATFGAGFDGGTGALLLGKGNEVVGILHNERCQENEQLGFCVFQLRVLEQQAEDGDIAQERHLAHGLDLVVLHETTYDHGFAVGRNHHRLG